MKKWHLVIDIEKCENCTNCFLSCKDEHVDNEWPGYAAPQPSQGQGWISILMNERGQYPLIDVGYLPVTCMHCDNAPCIKAAQDGAVYKRPDGIVIIDPIKARGQKNIVNACPYGVIRWNEELGLPQKCTLCAHLIDEGWTKTRCVQSCPTGALTIQYAEDTEMQKLIEDEKLEAYLPGHKTGPSIYYKNLYRFTRCFISGSIAVPIDGKEECAEGAKVTLSKANEMIGECVSDSFGDFKFDNLEEGTGEYSLLIEHDGYNSKTVNIKLQKSVNVGVIFL